MITIFNGRKRGLGQTNTEEVYLQVTVTLRQHLQQFKGAKCAVFMAVALHSDEHGWAKPSIALLEQETGYNKNTISQAIHELCRLEIDGHRVLLAFQGRRDNKADANRYLLFPTNSEVAEHEGQPGPFRRVDPLGAPGEVKQTGNNQNSSPPHRPAAGNGLHTEKLHTENQYAGKQDTEKLHTANPDVSITRGKKNQAEEEPRQSTRTHTRQVVARGASRNSVGGCAGSRFSPEEILRYVMHCKSQGQEIPNPQGLAIVLGRTGEADAFIEAIIHPAPVTKDEPRTVDATECPDCTGTGWWYPKGPERGIAKCKHARVSAS